MSCAANNTIDRLRLEAAEVQRLHSEAVADWQKATTMTDAAALLVEAARHEPPETRELVGDIYDEALRRLDAVEQAQRGRVRGLLYRLRALVVAMGQTAQVSPGEGGADGADR